MERIEREEKERLEKEKIDNISENSSSVVLNFHKKKFHKYSDSFSNNYNNEEQEDSKYEEEKIVQKKNKTYKSHKVVPNIDQEDLSETPIRRIYIKKKIDNKDEDESYKENNIYEKKIIKKQVESYCEESDKGSDYYIKKKKNNTVKNQSAIGSEKSIYISKRYLPTKLKIYKCVIYKNLDPDVNEDTIKSMLHRNGSQIMENGGFVVKLPNVQDNNINPYKLKAYKSHKNLLK